MMTKTKADKLITAIRQLFAEYPVCDMTVSHYRENVQVVVTLGGEGEGAQKVYNDLAKAPGASINTPYKTWEDKLRYVCMIEYRASGWDSGVDITLQGMYEVQVPEGYDDDE